MAADRIRVLNIFSDLEHSKMFELTAKHVDRSRFDFRTLFLNPADRDTPPLARAFQSLGIPTESWNFDGRRDFLPSLIKLRRHLVAESFHVVHTHLLWAYYVGMPAAWLAGVPQRLMTRWHATTHHLEYPHGLKYDRLANRLATRIVVPSAMTHRIVTEWEGVPTRKVTQLISPIDVNKFSTPPPGEVALLRARYNPGDRHPVIGVIARWVEWKGVQYIIPAVTRLLSDYPDLLLLLFNTIGDYGDELRALLSKLPERNYRTVKFEAMNEALYQVFDVFVHVPVDEYAETSGFIYSEALAAGAPSVFSLSGIATGLVEHLKHCYVVPHRSADAVYKGLRTLIDDPDLARRVGESGRDLLPPEMWPERYVRSLEQLYAEGVV